MRLAAHQRAEIVTAVALQARLHLLHHLLGLADSLRAKEEDEDEDKKMMVVVLVVVVVVVEEEETLTCSRIGMLPSISHRIALRALRSNGGIST